MGAVEVGYAVVGIAAMLALWGVGLTVLAAGPRRLANRAIAAYGLVGGTAVGTLRILYVVNDRGIAELLATSSSASQCAIPFVYLFFLGAALDTPLVAPFRARAGRIALAALAIAGFAAPFFLRGQYLTITEPIPSGGWLFTRGPIYVSFLGVGLLTFIYGVVCAIHAYSRAPLGSQQKIRAKAFALTFGLQELGVAACFLLVLPWSPPEIRALVQGIGFSIVTLVAAPFIAYVILRHQLFDIEIKIKRTIKQSTIAAALVGVFFIVSEGAQQFLSERWGPIIGLVGAGLLVFAIAPLQRVAERVSDRAMPHVAATPAYVAFRKMEVYKATVEEFIGNDGSVNEKERRVLERLRTQLGLGADDARAMEADVLAARGIPGATRPAAAL